MKILHGLMVICLAAGCATRAAADAHFPDGHPALYSFADLYRLTTNGAMSGVAAEPYAAISLGAEPYHVRVAAAQAAATPAVSELRFTITPVPGPGRWPLLLAGLATAAWVAHRRLTRPL